MFVCNYIGGLGFEGDKGRFCAECVFFAARRGDEVPTCIPIFLFWNPAVLL